MIQIHPHEFERYLRWRVATDIIPGNAVAADQLFAVFGTDPILVMETGELRSPRQFPKET